MNKTKNTVQVTLGVKHHFPQLPPTSPPPKHHACLLTVNLIIQQENCYLVIRNRGGKTFQQLYHVKIPPQSFIISPWTGIHKKRKEWWDLLLLSMSLHIEPDYCTAPSTPSQLINKNNTAKKTAKFIACWLIYRAQW